MPKKKNNIQAPEYQTGRVLLTALVVLWKVRALMRRSKYRREETEDVTKVIVTHVTERIVLAALVILVVVLHLEAVRRVDRSGTAVTNVDVDAVLAKLLSRVCADVKSIADVVDLRDLNVNVVVLGPLKTQREQASIIALGHLPHVFEEIQDGIVTSILHRLNGTTDGSGGILITGTAEESLPVGLPVLAVEGHARVHALVQANTRCVALEEMRANYTIPIAQCQEYNLVMSKADHLLVDGIGYIRRTIPAQDTQGDDRVFDRVVEEHNHFSDCERQQRESNVGRWDLVVQIMLAGLLLAAAWGGRYLGLELGGAWGYRRFEREFGSGRRSHGANGGAPYEAEVHATKWSARNLAGTVHRTTRDCSL